MARVTSWDKFKLLIWKNWHLQWNQKLQLVLELVLPALFSSLLVFLRTLVAAEPRPTTYFPPQNISNLNLLKEYLSFLPDAKPLDYTLGYSPENRILKQIVEEASTFLKLDSIRGYRDAFEMQHHLENRTHMAGVQFTDSWRNILDYPKDLSFALRFPSELRTSWSKNFPLTWLTTRLFMPIDLSGPRYSDAPDGGVPAGYLREGFLPIQHAISMAYIRQVTKIEELPYVDMQRFPYPPYIYDPLIEGLSSIVSLIMLLSFIYPCTIIVKSITLEKEKQLKEVMKIMGLNNWIHWTAWFVKSSIMLVISAILIIILMKIKWSNNVAVLTFGDWSVLLFFMLIYSITSVCFCFMLATFFSKASTAAAVTGLVWFIVYLPYLFTIEKYDNLSLGSKLGWCLIPNTAMGFAFRIILEFEGTGEGFQWSNLFTPVNIDDNLTVGAIIFMMLASSIVFICVCLYVEQILPGEFGVPKKWNFIFSPTYWCRFKEYISDEDIPNVILERQNPDAFEPKPSGKHVGLKVRNLKKKFGDKMAVRGLSVNMYEDEIMVLLGHNGAGKTTTISMLTGMFPPTAGTAIINGCDICTDIEGARISMGICPQHNVLFDDLTVAQHLIFFSCLKGLKGGEINREVDKYVKLIDLEAKANVVSKNLSGGMKRKLSICCALTGNTKVVLCDEPSSGMDPSARRQLWDLLQQEKIGRTILLTTHFMDEADVLGDRIAIMSDGELKCHGTSFFLKKKFGSGYRLICVKREGCNVDKITALLQTFIPGLEPESDIGAELSYQLTDNYSSKFEEMLSSLEDQSDDLKLNGYGIGITSLEEVLAKVGAEKVNLDSSKQASIVMNTYLAYAEGDAESITSENLFSANIHLQTGLKLLWSHWQAMILKKLLYTYRNKLLFLIQNSLPIIFTTLSVLISHSQGLFRPLQPITMSLTQYPSGVTVLDVDSNAAQGSLHYKIAEKYKSVAKSYGSDYEFIETGRKSFKNFILGLGEDMQVRINSKYFAAASIRKGHITAWFNNQPIHTAPLTVNLVHNAIVKALKDDSYQITVTNAPLPYTAQTKLIQLNIGSNLGTQLSINLCFCFCFVSAFYILFLIKERESRSKLLQFVGGVKVSTFWLSHFISDILTFSLTAAIVILTIFGWQEKGLSTFVELGRFFWMLTLFGCSVIPLTYLISFYFSEPATGFASISVINVFAGLALFILVLVMSFAILNTKKKADLLGWFFRIFPHFSLAMGLNKMYVNSATRDACNAHTIVSLPEDSKCLLVPSCCNIVSFFAWEEPGVLPEMTYLIVTAIIHFLILIGREYGLIRELCNKIKQRSFKLSLPPEDGYFDEDVNQEKQRIIDMSQSEIKGTNLVLDRITKYYGNFLAVNQVSLCVKPAECFGLLGVNGAGKTTTFKMLTGDEHITFGSAYVRGLSLASEMNEIYKEIGYCPQFDGLLEDLTGREILKIFCLLRGVRKKRINHISEELAKSFGFSKHLDKETKAYSGGSKRKLSSAIAFIGSPTVIYLDEPTTSMDPMARRQLWNMVCRIRDSGKSIVLTSHSMEECEALCTRLAIMVNGEFKCIGSTQHLKNKFSKGLILKIKVKRNLELVKNRSSVVSDVAEDAGPAKILEQDIQNVKTFVGREFPRAILREEYQGVLTFYIPFASIKWSKIFGLMERNRGELNIEDFSISQTTLEEIFLDFAKHQREDTRQIKTSKNWDWLNCKKTNKNS